MTILTTERDDIDSPPAEPIDEFLQTKISCEGDRTMRESARSAAASAGEGTP